MSETYIFISSIVVVFFSIIVHECAHGWMANRCGDPTAKLAGRLTFNPLKHIDLFGTVIVPGVLLFMRSMGYPVVVVGWAKPVPVNFARLRNPKRDVIWVGMAGPVINMAIALVFRSLLLLPLSPELSELCLLAIFVNLLLAVFNLIPIPPLDGSRLVTGLLPYKIAKAYVSLEPYGLVIVILLLYFGLLDKVVLPLIVMLGQLMGVQLS